MPGEDKDREAELIPGAPEGYDAFLLAESVQARSRTLLWIVPDDARAAQCSAALEFFAPGLDLIRIPAFDCLPYARISPTLEIAAARAAGLVRLGRRKEKQDAPCIVLATVNACLQRVPPGREMARRAFPLQSGREAGFDRLRGFLAVHGFERAQVAARAGEYALRGGLADICLPWAKAGGAAAASGATAASGAAAVRVDFFGDGIESLRRFDPSSQRSSGPCGRITLFPASEIALTRAAVSRFRRNWLARFGGGAVRDPLYAAVSAGRRAAGMEHWLPLFYEEMESVFSGLPAGTEVVFDPGCAAALEERWSAVAEAWKRRSAEENAQTRKGQGELPPYQALPPDALYLDRAEWEKTLAEWPRHILSPFPLGEGSAASGQARAGRRFGKGAGAGLFDRLKAHIAELQKAGKRVGVAAWSRGACARLARLFAEYDFPTCHEAEDWQGFLSLPAQDIGLVVLGLESGFEAETFALIGEQDILGERAGRRTAGRKSAARALLMQAQALMPGDLVVHVAHGVGRFEGLRRIEAAGAFHDCFAIAYAGGGRLLLPVENADLLMRYGGGEAGIALDRLDSAAWQARKARVKKRLLEMAGKLIALAAVRTQSAAARLTPPAGLYEEFCARFPFEETEDQARAIADVLADLSSGRPMDRLICGDVGFGKTEVAMRGAFVAAMGGKQVAVIAPTTLLARQHAATFRARFEALPVRIGHVSRLASPAERRAAERELAGGEMNIVIGTHALLSDKIRFRDPGLLIIDEEQRFGVADKEKLKEMKAGVHVLALSATPIPRSLQLALSGARAMSLIGTPPADRLAVRTYIGPFDGPEMRAALLREQARGGRSFFICPRISDLGEAAEFLRQSAPELAFAFAHGQMPAAQLEKAVAAFYDGRVDVLLCTHIVESGLDIPQANTMIIWRAHMFGLADLHQLRGRIGRGRTRAYAWMTLPPGREMTPQAVARLGALQAVESLGAGFTLAAQDLDLRGAGNLLGAEQSGHIREVGYELYQSMLAEAIAESRSGAGEPEEAPEESPRVSLGASALIPEEYVGDLGVRLSLYRRLAELRSGEEIGDFAAELVDRFGPLPEEAEHLLEIVRIKLACREAGLASLEAGAGGAVMTFRGRRFANPEGLVALIAREGSRARLRPDHGLVVRRDWPGLPERLAGVRALLGEIEALARSPVQG